MIVEVQRRSTFSGNGRRRIVPVGGRRRQPDQSACRRGVKSGMIREVHAGLFNLPDEEPAGWEPDCGLPRGGW
jgi:hypothetical protein